MSSAANGTWARGTMTAARIAAPRRVEVSEIPIPEARPDSVLVQPACVGLCGTDLELLHATASYVLDGRTRFPHVFGHEWCGRVVALGAAARGFEIGDRVVGHTMVACGLCRSCQRGRRALCQRLTEVGLYGQQGAAAEYIAMPATSLTRLPDGLSNLSAALIEPAVTVVGAFDRASCKLDDHVAVVGTGTIGLLAIQLAARVAASVDAIGIDDAGLELATACGARRALRPEEAQNGSYSLVIEASGAAPAFVRCLDLAEPGGRVALVGVANEAAPGIAPGAIALRGIDVFGIRHGLDYYDRTISLFAAGVLRAEPLIAAVLPIAEAARAFDLLEHGRRGPPKVVLSFGDDEPTRSRATRTGRTS